MTTPGNGRDHGAKDRLKKLIDWVNADENLPTIEEPGSDDDLAADKRQEPCCELNDSSDEDCPAGCDTAALSPDLDQETEDYEGDNEFEYPDEVTHEEIEDFDEDYVAGDETLSAAPHEILHLTVQQKKQMKHFRLFYLVLSAIVALNLIVLLLLTVSYLPEFGVVDRPSVNEVYVRYVEQSLEDTGALNMVAAVLFSYRSFDTLGEAFVLFTAVIAVMILMQKPKDEDVKEDEANTDRAKGGH